MSDPITRVGRKLDGKVAIITGGASGIGEATARLFSDEGAQMVVIADIQDQLGQSVAASIGAHRCIYTHCDVTDEDQVRSMVESTVKNYGHLDIMFCNAGICNRAQSIMEIDLQAMDRLFAINVRGVAACVKHAARVMIESGVRGGENIVCTASVYASRGATQYEDYTMSKHAVLGLVRSASCELGKYGIRVNCVCPGPVATPLLLNALGMTDKEMAEKAFSSFPKLEGTALKVGHVADAVLFLASDQSAFVTGHNLVVDGPVATPLMLYLLGSTDKESAEKEISSLSKLKGTVLKVDHLADAVLFLASDLSAFVTGHNLVVDGGLLAS